MLKTAKIKLAALYVTAVLVVGGATVGGITALAQPGPLGMRGGAMVVGPPAAPAAPGAASIGVLTGLTPAQVVTLPIVLRGQVKSELQNDPDFKAMPAAFQEELIGNWDHKIAVHVLDAGSGTVMLTLDIQPPAERKKAGDLVTNIYLRRLRADKENWSIDLRRVYTDDMQRAENDVENIDKHGAEFRRTNALVELPPSTAVRDALIQARIDLIRAKAQDAVQHMDDVARQIKILEKVVQDLTALQAEETTKAVDLALKLEVLQRIESERSLPIAQRDAAAQKINEIRIADITKGPAHLIATAE